MDELEVGRAIGRLMAENDKLAAEVRRLREREELLTTVEKAAKHVLMTVSVTEYDERDFHLALEDLVKALDALARAHATGGQSRSRPGHGPNATGGGVQTSPVR